MSEKTKIVTLGDLANFVRGLSDLSPSRKRDLVSALNRAREILGKGQKDFTADPRLVLPALDRFSPAMAGLSRPSFANLKSRVRAAFRLASPSLASARSFVRLTGHWAEISQQLTRRDRLCISRFLKFLQTRGCQPKDINDEWLNRFALYLSETVVRDRPDKPIRETVRVWNRAVVTLPAWSLTQLAQPPRKREPYWVRLDDLPSGLRQDIEGYLKRLAHADPFSDGPSMPLATTTIEQYRYFFIQLVSALVGSGMALGELDSLRKLILPKNVRTALAFLYARAGDVVNDQIHGLTYRASKVAQHIPEYSEQDINELKQIRDQVKARVPNRRDLTAKNHGVLDHMDDPAFVARFLMLPKHLMHSAIKMKNPRLAASCARDAVAIELLITCSMRVANLVDLRIGETIRKYGETHAARWMIEIPAEKVKNNQPLRFSLPDESVPILESYLEKWHQHWCGATAWLFPSRNGKCIGKRSLTTIIANRTRRELGVAVTCHQFRHLSAELYLREDPNGIGVVSQHLGHRDYNTTKRFYARSQTRVATEHYQQVLTRKRAKASPYKSKKQTTKSDRNDPTASQPAT